MLTIYTTPSCSSCRKAKKWLDDHRVEYREKNIFNIQLTKDDIYMMLRNTEDGFNDIISTRSKVFVENNLNIEEMSISELTQFIIDNPSVLRRPIMIDEAKLQVGYNEDEIRMFIPKRLRELIMCSDCTSGHDCDYKKALDTYFEELRQEELRKNHR